MALLKRNKVPLRAGLAGAALVSIVGVVLVIYPMGLDRLSYDLPFRYKEVVPAELMMVYVSDAAKVSLGERAGDALPRRYYTQLVDKLSRDGARMVVFDILLDTTDRDAQVDKAFAEAVRAHGAVVLVGEVVNSITMNIAGTEIVPPVALFTNAAAGWGLASLAKDPDYAVRVIHPGESMTPSVGWVAAALLGADIARNPDNRFRPRWLNHCGPLGTIPAVNIDQALGGDDHGVPPGFFRGKIVVIGLNSSVDAAGASSDTFANPWSRFGQKFSPGADVHATTILNLLRHEWLQRLAPVWEIAVVVLWGSALGMGLMSLRPWHAGWVTVASSGLLAGASFYLQLHQRLWWCWFVPAAVQSPIALVWSVGYQYLVEARKRRKLRQAFSSYLSPVMADQITDSGVDLSLGGEEVEATVMFTDLEGFTAMSEHLPPKAVSRILTTYFNQTTRDILKEDGTIIKYIGDAVMAVWGAPLPDPNQAERAVLAACGMIAAGRREVEGRYLRTRIGINTGLVLAGNLGSDFRFDYTLIGNTTNFASRLEGLNKYLCTDILISDSTRQRVGSTFKIRSLGRFRVVGKQEAVGIHEVLGLATDFPPTLPWLDSFERGLDSFQRGDFEQARIFFQAAIAQRGPPDRCRTLDLCQAVRFDFAPRPCESIERCLRPDGPSHFYLKYIEEKYPAHSTHSDWDGIVQIDAK
ncbi:MAG TPA: adenylate/guanylate cyclase domain-containing protein [Verrucomicrobiae bacterium]|jgi:adenylate cyclase